MVAINNTSILFQSIFTILNITVDQEEVRPSYNNYLRSIGKEAAQSKCYGMYGCYSLDSPWTSENRPVALLPESIRKVEPKLTYYTRDNPIHGTRFDLDVQEVIAQSGINPHLPIYLVTHGYTESGQHPWIKSMTRELLIRENANVIVVDWQGGSSPPYTQAVANIRLVSAIVAHFLADLAEHTNDNLEHVHCIGHSLGAHLFGYVGYILQDSFDDRRMMLGRITGMDPAEPHFAKAKRPVRLDKSAAKYVDIIHTDASQFIRGGLGIIEAIGHVDFYPNGGMNQPGCDKSVTEFAIESGGSLFNGIKKFLGCNHIRSYLYFIESINSNCSFYSITCRSYEDFKTGKCFECNEFKGRYCFPMGYNSRKHYENLVKRRILKPNQSIVQYLRTGDGDPFCKSHYKISVLISNTRQSKDHGGEIGQLWFVFHDTTDKRGEKTHRVALNNGGYHEPGTTITEIVMANKVINLKAVEVEWDYHINVFNPLTWRLETPRLHVEKIKVESLETKARISVCPKDINQPFIAGIPQLMLPSYC